MTGFRHKNSPSADHRSRDLLEQDEAGGRNVEPQPLHV